MASEFGRKFYDLLRIHIEQGIKSQYLDLNDEHRRCVDIIDDLYEHWRHNPAMNITDYIRNKYDITDYPRIYKLSKALNFVCGLMSAGQRDLQRYKANFYADRILRIGDSTGDWKAIEKGLAHVEKVNALDQPDPAESIDEQIPKMGYMLTTRASDVHEQATDHTPEQIEALFRHYNVRRDVWQQQLNRGRSTADDYDADGNYIRRGRIPQRSQSEDAEDAELLDLEDEFQKEVDDEFAKERERRGYSVENQDLNKYK